MSTRIEFSVGKWRNVFQPSGKEWALQIRFPGGALWTLATYPEEPSDEVLKEDKALVLRAFEVYHQNINWPKFDLEVT